MVPVYVPAVLMIQTEVLNQIVHVLMDIMNPIKLSVQNVMINVLHVPLMNNVLFVKHQE